jgi:hypothetical protein
MTPPGTHRDTRENAQDPSSSKPDAHPHGNDSRSPRASPAKDTTTAVDERRTVTDERPLVPAHSDDLPYGEAPPLPYDEAPPPLPEEAPPQDDGWDCHWDANANRYYFLNRFTGTSQWENPRVPETAPAINGSYDRFANYSSPSSILSYPNPCLSQIC